MAAIVLAVLLPSCAPKHPERNNESDLARFSRIPDAWALSQGAGTRVAVLDWQFDPAGPAAAQYVFATSLIPGERMGDLKPWHGAEMVNIVHYVAPAAQIIPIIARSSKRGDYQASLIQGIRYAADHGAVAVTNSMGLVKQSPALREAIDDAERRGTVFVDVHPEDLATAADSFTPCDPGMCDPRILHTGVVSVPQHPLKPHPSRDVYTWPYDLNTVFQDGWGFSNAPPIVAGVIALMKSANPALSPASLRRLLVETAVEREGFRVVDAEAAVRAALVAQ